jgi:RNA polymerase sigma-70 factor (ECF subfamily)
MTGPEFDERLSRISTYWSMVVEAHSDRADDRQAAQNQLLQRYSGAAYRYLLGAVRDPDTATELAQEFALRFIRGDFHRANPERGRFRDYLKTALVHLVTDYYRSQQARPKPLGDDFPDRVAATSAESAEHDFLTSWRVELLDRTWRALADANPAYHAVLLCRVESPDMPSAEIAEKLQTTLGREMTAACVRKNLQRAHERFADLLVDEVAQSLDNAQGESLNQELRELDLLKYCQSAIARRKDRNQEPGVRNDGQD